MLENVQQATILPIVKTFIEPGTLVNTDEYNIYGRLTEWEYEHKSVCHAAGKYARNENGDGFHGEHDGGIVVVVTELVASSSRDFAGATADLCGIFQFMHNTRRRGKALLHSLVEALVNVNPEMERAKRKYRSGL